MGGYVGRVNSERPRARRADAIIGRTLSRPILVFASLRDGFVEMLPACVGLAPFGLVCGVGVAAAGADWLAAFGMSALIFSGAAQIVAAQLYATGAPLAVIVLTCFVLGLRFLMYSAAMAPHVKMLPDRWQRGLAFVLNDQAFAAVIRRFAARGDAPDGASYFLGSGIALWLAWQTTNILGFFAGHLIPADWALDFAVPLCFLALIAPLLRDVPNVVAAAVAGIAVLALADLPMRLNLIVAGMFGIVAGLAIEIVRERWKAR